MCVCVFAKLWYNHVSCYIISKVASNKIEARSIADGENDEEVLQRLFKQKQVITFISPSGFLSLQVSLCVKASQVRIMPTTVHCLLFLAFME